MLIHTAGQGSLHTCKLPLHQVYTKLCAAYNNRVPCPSLKTMIIKSMVIIYPYRSLPSDVLTPFQVSFPPFPVSFPPFRRFNSSRYIPRIFYFPFSLYITLSYSLENWYTQSCSESTLLNSFIQLLSNSGYIDGLLYIPTEGIVIKRNDKDIYTDIHPIVGQDKTPVCCVSLHVNDALSGTNSIGTNIYNNKEDINNCINKIKERYQHLCSRAYQFYPCRRYNIHYSYDSYYIYSISPYFIPTGDPIASIEGSLTSINKYYWDPLSTDTSFQSNILSNSIPPPLCPKGSKRCIEGSCISQSEQCPSYRICPRNKPILCSDGLCHYHQNQCLNSMISIVFNS
ncbi:hypothetical protein WA158_006907 [Blastocystis sp. Blastoise]